MTMAFGCTSSIHDATMRLRAWLFSIKRQQVIILLLIVQAVIALNSLRHQSTLFGELVNNVLNFTSLENGLSENNSNPLIINTNASSTFPPPRDGNATFSACLLVMDENHRLDEWLAFHYYVMPLRYLVVAVDPNSKTSPTKILDKWRDYITIIEWSDKNFTTRDLSTHDKDTMQSRTGKHRLRQSFFYGECTKYLRQQNRTWTSYHDVDEFMVINTDVVKNATLGEASILQMIHKYTQNHTRSPDEPNFWYQHFQQSPCITIARSLYGAVQSTTEEINQNVPDFVNATRLETLRWRYRATPRRRAKNGLAKSVVDVSRVVDSDLEPRPSSHRPLPTVCPTPFVNYDQLPMGIHHYLGSWEMYSFREDARKGLYRTVEAWKERAVLQDGGPDDEIRPWIAGFVSQVGAETAKKLLRDAGLPPTYTISEHRMAEWSVQVSNSSKPRPG